jgi:hypothetical protein
MGRYGGMIPAAKWEASWSLGIALTVTALVFTTAAVLVLVLAPRWQRQAKQRVLEREEQVRIASEHVRERAVRTRKWAERMEAKVSESAPALA